MRQLAIAVLAIMMTVLFILSFPYERKVQQAVGVSQLFLKGHGRNVEFPVKKYAQKKVNKGVKR